MRVSAQAEGLGAAEPAPSIPPTRRFRRSDTQSPPPPPPPGSRPTLVLPAPPRELPRCRRSKPWPLVPPPCGDPGSTCGSVLPHWSPPRPLGCFCCKGDVANVGGAAGVEDVAPHAETAPPCTAPRPLFELRDRTGCCSRPVLPAPLPSGKAPRPPGRRGAADPPLEDGRRKSGLVDSPCGPERGGIPLPPRFPIIEAPNFDGDVASACCRICDKTKCRQGDRA